MEGHPFLVSVFCSLLIFLGGTVFCLTRSKMRSQVRQRLRIMQEMAAMHSVGSTASGKRLEKLEDVPLFERAIAPLLQYLGRHLSRLTPASVRAMLERRLMLAGKQYVWHVNTFAAIWFASGLVGLFLGFFYITNHPDMAFVQRFSFVIILTVAGNALPFLVLHTLITKRQKELLRQLPEVLDLLCVSVQAGLSFDASVTRIAERMHGAFIDECNKMLRDMRMGMNRRTALQNLAKRCDLQDIHLFVAAILQSDRLGTSMGKTLETQAANMRERRMQYAKGQALKAPIKIIFPLVIFIFPALFVVVLMPTVLVLMKNLIK